MKNYYYRIEIIERFMCLNGLREKFEKEIDLIWDWQKWKLNWTFVKS